jgi:hypothetical protein
MRATKHPSPAANKIGKYSLIIEEVGFSLDETSAEKQLIL